MTHRSKMTTSIRIATTRAMRQTKEAVMRKLLPVLILALTLTAIVGAQTSVTPAGSGTESDPYQITELGNLAWLSNQTSITASIKLMNDIDASETATWNDGAGFEPIGSETAQFIGVFDGNGKKISELTISSSEIYNLGFFGYVGANGIIKNLGIEGTKISMMNRDSISIGALAGISFGSIVNCYTTSSLIAITTSDSYSCNVGGLVGLTLGTISDCYAMNNEMRVSSYASSVGGLVGRQDKGTIANCYAMNNYSYWNPENRGGGLVGSSCGSIVNCYTMGSFSGIFDVFGGLVGDSSGTITKCYSTVNSSGGYVGGLVGTGDGTITNCYASGSVIGSKYAGGLVGSGSGRIENCFATGDVSLNVEWASAGGLCGLHRGTIENCYATGHVSGFMDYFAIGGLVGQDGGSTMTIVRNCYYDSQTTGFINGIGTPKTTAEMYQQSTFSDWDFDNVWCLSASYPLLRCFVDSGLISAFIDPPEAVYSNAKWSYNGGISWFDNGVQINVAVSNYSIMFSDIDGWATPQAESVDVESSKLSTVIGTYKKLHDIVLVASDFNSGVGTNIEPGAKVDFSWDVTADSEIAEPFWCEVFGSKTGGFDQLRTGVTLTSSYKAPGMDLSEHIAPSSLILNSISDGVYTLMPSVNRGSLPESSRIEEADYVNNWMSVAGKRLSIRNTKSAVLDLQVVDASMSIDPSNPKRVTVTGKMKNDSGVNLTKPGAWVEVFYGTLTAEGTLMPQGTIGAGQNINTLAAGESAEFTLSGTVPAGVANRALAVVVDSTDIVPETNEVNNSQLFYDPLILPPGKDNGIDLAITNMIVDAVQLAPNQVAPESKLKYSVTVQNKGTTMPSEQVYLELFASQNGGVSNVPGVSLTWSEKITAPALGETQTYNFEKTINSIGDGMYTLVAEVNRDGASTNPGDMTPLDNKFAYSAGRVSLSTPAIAGTRNIVWSEGPTFTQSGSKMTVSGTIKNVGNATTRAFWVEAFVGTMQAKTGYFYKDTNTVFAGGINCTLKANEEKAITLTGTVPSGKVVGVLADSTDVVAETNETDNYDYGELLAQ